jgi:hypothetical protein
MNSVSGPEVEKSNSGARGYISYSRSSKIFTTNRPMKSQENISSSF